MINDLPFIDNQANAKSFERIETGIFVLCLDQPYAEQESRLSAAGNQMLHGGGSNVNTGNRWFDKCLQVGQVYFGATCELSFLARRWSQWRLWFDL